MVSNIGLNFIVKRGGKNVISCLCHAKYPKTPINFEGLRYAPALEKDVAQIDKVKVIKEKLTSVLSSEYCEMPDFMARIPKGASEKEKLKLLSKMFEDSKFFSRVSTCEEMYGKNFEFAEMMSKLSKETSQTISEGKSFKDVLKRIANGYSKETKIDTEYKSEYRLCNSGKYRGNDIYSVLREG